MEERLVELWKCNKNSCQGCKNVRETDTFQYFVDKIHVAIIFWLTFCHVRYVFMQYNVQTNDEFRYWWNNYKDNNRKSVLDENHKQAGFFANFQTAGHSGFVNDTEIRYIDKTDSPDTNRREHFGIDTVKTVKNL